MCCGGKCCETKRCVFFGYVPRRQILWNNTACPLCLCRIDANCVKTRLGFVDSVLRRLILWNKIVCLCCVCTAEANFVKQHGLFFVRWCPAEATFKNEHCLYLLFMSSGGNSCETKSKHPYAFCICVLRSQLLWTKTVCLLCVCPAGENFAATYGLSFVFMSCGGKVWENKQFVCFVYVLRRHSL